MYYKNTCWIRIQHSISPNTVLSFTTTTEPRSRSKYHVAVAVS